MNVDTESILASIRNDAPHEVATELLEQALNDGDFSRSVSNCHTAGMDSIVLYDHTADGGGMVRFFWAKTGGHKLVHLYNRRGHFMLGVHNHRYPIALVPLVGTIGNVRAWLTDKPTGEVLHEYAFESALADDDTEAIRTVYRRPRNLDHVGMYRQEITPGDVAVMAPADLHTIHVPDDHSVGTAWMVVEGPAVDIEPLIYSPREDLTITSDDLYLPMTRERALGVTELVLALARQG